MEKEDKNLKVKLLGLLFDKKVNEIFNMYKKGNYYLNNKFKFNFITIDKELKEYTKEEIKQIKEIKQDIPFSISDQLLNTIDIPKINNPESDEIVNINTSKEFNIIKNGNDLNQPKKVVNEINLNDIKKS